MGGRTAPGEVVVQAPGLSLSHRLPTLVVWLSLGLRGPGVARRAGEAREGFAKLEAAVPSSLDIPGGASSGGRMGSVQAGQDADRVVVGMDPHERSVTIEVMAGDETILGAGGSPLPPRATGRCAPTWPGRNGVGHRGLRRDRRTRRHSAAGRRRAGRRVPPKLST